MGGMILTLSSPALAQPTVNPQGLVWLEVVPQSSEAESRLEVRHSTRKSSIRMQDIGPGLYLICWGGDGAGVRCERQLIEQPTEVTRQPVLGVPVTGAVLVGRQPVVEARIQVVPEGLAFRRAFTTPLGLDGETRELRRSVLTDEKGRFTLPALAPGDWSLEIHLPGGRLEHSEPFSISERWATIPTGETAPPIFDLGLLVFHPGTQLEVFVTDSFGVPVPVAEVGGAQGAKPLESDFFEVRTDEEGRALITGLEPTERLSLACTAPGYNWVREQYDAPPATATCVLEALVRLQGVLVDVDEEPIPGGTASLEGNRRRALSGDDGTFEITDLVPGSYTLTLSAPGLEGRTVEVELAPGEEVDLGDLELSPGRELLMQVVDAETGAPVAGARLNMLHPPGGGTAVTDEDGGARFLTGSAKNLQVEARAPGYAPLRTEIARTRLDSGEPSILELQRAGRVEVRAWQDDGSPCVGCTATILGPTLSSITVRTDVDGRAVSEELSPDRYQVNLTRERSLGQVVQVSGGDDVRWADVEPRRTSVVLFGEPAETLRVRVDSPLPPGWKLRARGAGWVRHFEPGSEARIRRQPGEAVRLSVVGPGGTNVEQSTIPGDYSSDVFDLALPQAGVSGVVSREQVPQPGKTVLLRSVGSGAAQATTRTGPNGSFMIPYLTLGQYVIQIQDRPVRSVAIAPGRVEDVGQITLPADS